MLSKKIIISMFALVMCGAAMAQGTKFGIVDADRVIQESKKGKQFFEELQAFVKSKQDEIDVDIKAFQEKEKEFKSKMVTLSTEKRDAMAAQLQEMQVKLKRMTEDAENERQRRITRALEKFRQELSPLVRQVALEKSLDIVMNLGPEHQVVYFSESIDITKEVIAKYDAMP